MHQFIDWFYRGAVRQMDHMTTTHWLIALIVVMVAGGICMRGFGSRSGY
jgi:hypothetical protein